MQDLLEIKTKDNSTYKLVAVHNVWTYKRTKKETREIRQPDDYLILDVVDNREFKLPYPKFIKRFTII